MAAQVNSQQIKMLVKRINDPFFVLQEAHHAGRGTIVINRNMLLCRAFVQAYNGKVSCSDTLGIAGHHRIHSSVKDHIITFCNFF
jgi:hypothetical protein